MTTTAVIPSDFIWRRVHSLMGVWLVLFVILHLLVNAQAVLMVGDDGHGFIQSANMLESLPLLPVVELLVLGLPIAIHIIWGVLYLRSAKYNSFSTDGSSPALPEYSRNKAYTWQRITAWLLIVGIIAHVIHMRFLERPIEAQEGSTRYYMVRVTQDAGLYTLGARLDVDFYDQGKINRLKALLKEDKDVQATTPLQKQKEQQSSHVLETLQKRPLKPGQVIVVAKDYGTADLFMLRDTFKMPVMLVLYTLLVLGTVFHAFNGIWTALIKWGITLTRRSQRLLLNVCTALMLIVGFLGLASVWGTYWINLKQ